MKEEDIDNRIGRVVESVASKKTAMRQWESDRISSEMQRRVALKRWRTYGISAAASVVVVCGIGLGLYFNNTSNSEYGVNSSTPVFRGGTAELSDIETMIDSGDYEGALQTINNFSSDTVIDSSLSPERREYQRSLYRNQEYELTWLKISALYKMGRIDETIRILESYSTLEGVHKIEAEQLLKELNK